MATVLESPKPAVKQEEFVEKQINQARQRIRQLDYFASGGVLLIASLLFVLAYLFVDRYVETPGWMTWGVVGIYLLGAAGFLYLSLFRPSRRAINPYYAAKQVEDTLTDAKNSVVNWVDLKDDEKIPGSVRSALGTRAARDLRHVDLNQVIQKSHLLWLAGIAGVLLLAALVVGFLPPTRTQITLLSPKDGDVTVVQGEDVKIEVELKGRIPAKGQPDAARMRIWTNPETPNDYEERPLEPSEDSKKIWKLTIPSKQIRSGGFRYKLLAGNVQTRDYQVTLRIRPEFAGFVVNYNPPAWLKRQPETTNDPNIVGFYGTDISLTAQINKPVRGGNIEVDGQVQLIPGEVVNESQDALKFAFKLERNASYRIRFLTTEGEKNTDAKTYTIKVLDAQPKFSEYEVAFKYPKYLRFEDEKITVREPNLEAMRGTEVNIVAFANRRVKSSQLIVSGQPPILGQLDKEEPTKVKFSLPALMEDGSYTLSFIPDTGEKETTTSPFIIKVNLDQKPTIAIVLPIEEQIELPANGTLHVEGRATDDIGIAKVTLRMEVVSGGNQPLAPKPYRDGKSFKSDKDGSYPTELEYFDIVELAKVKPEGNGAAGFQLRPGMIVEYWLEAEDNCTVGGPNVGISRKQRIKVLAPVTAPEKKKEQEQQNVQEQKEKQERQQQQDEKLKNEKRDPKQKPKQADQPKKQEPQAGNQKGSEDQPKEGNPEKGDPMGGKGESGEPQPRKNSKEDDSVEQKAKDFENILPKEPNPPEPKKEELPQPKEHDPKNQPMTGDMNPNEAPKPEDFQKIADQLQSNDPKEREDAQKKLEQSMKDQKKNPEAQKEAQKKLEEARDKMTPEQKKELDDAMKKAQENLKKEQDKEEQKNKEDAKKKLDEAKELAKKLDSKDENERKQAKEQIQQMMKEQSKAKQDSSQEQQEDIKKHLNEEQRKDLAKAREKINDEMQKQVQEKKEQQAQQQLNEMKDLNEKLKSKDQNERKQAQEKLDKLMQEQAKANPEESEKHSQETRDNLQNEQQKKDFDQAQENLQKAMQKRAQQKRQDDAEDHLHRLQETAKNLDSKDDDERKKAEEDIERLTRQKNQQKANPKEADEAKKKEEELRKNLPNDEQRQAFDKAKDKVEQAVKKKTQQQKQEQAQQQLDAMKNLAKNLDSKDENVKKAAQDQLEKMRKEQAKTKPEDAEKQKDDVRNNLKDENQKKEFDQTQQKLASEMQKQEEAKRPKPEDIQQAAKQLAKDGNSPEKQQAQDKLEDWMKDPKNKDRVEKGLDDAKKEMNPQQQKNVDKALDEAKKSGQEDAQAAKNVAEQAKKLADKLNSKDPKEKQQAQEGLEKAMKQASKDPRRQDEAQKELDKVRSQLPKDQQADFDKSMQQIADHMKGQEPGEKSAPKPDDIKKTADKLAKQGNSPQKQEAQEKLEDWMKDPKNKEQVEKELDKLAKDMKDPQGKQNLEKAIKEAKEKVAKNTQEPKGDNALKLKPEDVEKLAKQLQADGNGKAKQDAMKKLEEALKDPKQREQIQKQLEQMKKDLADETAKKNLDDAMKQMAKDLQQPESKTPKLPKSEDVEKLAKQLQEMDKKGQEAASKKLEEMMKDPKAREEIQKQLDEFKKNIKDEQAKKEFEQQLKNLAEQLAKHDRDTTPKGNKDSAPPAVAELKHKLHAGELLLEKFKREMTNEEFRKQSNMTPAQLAEFQKKYEEYLARLRQDLDRMEKEVITRGSGKSNLNQTDNVKLDPRGSGEALQGGRYTAPPGFADPYKKFTEEISGVKNPPKN